VGTRNYIAILASVNCSAHTIHEITRYYTPEKLVAYPNVDGVIARLPVWRATPTSART
jgi:altronate hydrolase